MKKILFVLAGCSLLLCNAVYAQNKFKVKVMWQDSVVAAHPMMRVEVNGHVLDAVSTNEKGILVEPKNKFVLVDKKAYVVANFVIGLMQCKGVSSGLSADGKMVIVKSKCFGD